MKVIVLQLFVVVVSFLDTGVKVMLHSWNEFGRISFSSILLNNSRRLILIPI
jgi:hypothetical protein